MGTGRADNEKLQYAGDQVTKFGIYREQFAEALALAASYRLTVTRIHLHTGCGYLNQQLPQWQKVLEQSLWFIEQVPSVKAVNIGGGLGVPHVATDQPLNLDKWAKTLAKVMGGKPWRIEIEPGEYLAKDAGLLILEKTFVEQKIWHRNRPTTACPFYRWPYSIPQKPVLSVWLATLMRPWMSGTPT